MARPLSSLAEKFVATYHTNIEAGLDEADAWTAARLIVPPDLWTRSFKTVVSRYLKKVGLKTQDRRGGNQRDALTQAVFKRVREAQQAMKQARELMQGELDIAMERAARIITGEAPWLTPDIVADTERKLRSASTWRCHEVDRITAPAIAASLHVQQVRRYWVDSLEAIREDAMADIRAIVANTAYSGVIHQVFQ